jgi:hypothetical protein
MASFRQLLTQCKTLKLAANDGTLNSFECLELADKLPR